MSQLFMETVIFLKPKLEIYEDFEATCEAVLKVICLTQIHVRRSVLRTNVLLQVEEEFTAVLRERVQTPGWSVMIERN